MAIFFARLMKWASLSELSRDRIRNAFEMHSRCIRNALESRRTSKVCLGERLTANWFASSNMHPALTTLDYTHTGLPGLVVGHKAAVSARRLRYLWYLRLWYLGLWYLRYLHLYTFCILEWASLYEAYFRSLLSNSELAIDWPARPSLQTHLTNSPY